MSRGPDAGTLLARAIERCARDAGIALSITRADWTRWASATFAGARHEIELRAVPADLLDGWIGALPDADLSVPTMLVADLVVVGVERDDQAVMIRIEALTVEA